MSLEEFGGELPINRLPGHWVGKVENLTDPLRLMRVQVRVVGVHTDEVSILALPWAEYLLPTGCRPNNGMFNPCKVGDYVWVDFPYQGDPRRPRITGSVHYAPGKVPTLPAPAFGTDYHRTVILRENGCTVEIKPDTTFHITQDTTGTFVRIEPNGTITVHVVKDVGITVHGNVTAQVDGNVTATVDGDVTTTVKGDVDATVNGNVAMQVDGDIDATVVGTVTAQVDGNVGVTVAGSMTAQVNGDVSVGVNGNVGATVQGSLWADINGDVSADVRGNVGATIHGGATVVVTGTVAARVTGPVSAFITGPLTADVTAPITIRSPAVNIFAPLTTVTGNMVVTGSVFAGGEISDDISGRKTLATLRAKYNSHRHAYLDQGPITRPLAPPTDMQPTLTQE